MIERLGIPVFLAPLPTGIFGLASRVNGRWYVVGDSSKGTAGRLRFTLAHELGHVVLDHAPSVDDESTLMMRGGASQEVDANYFAAELLLPRHAVEDVVMQYPSLDSADDQAKLVLGLARDYGTTLWVPLYRLRTLDLIEPSEEEALREVLPALEFSDDLKDVVSDFARTGKTRLPPSQ
jgi:Zn-dependent peptidase ImmA (M78 family)